MKIKYQIFLLILLPFLLITTYQFYTIHSIAEERNNVRLHSLDKMNAAVDHLVNLTDAFSQNGAHIDEALLEAKKGNARGIYDNVERARELRDRQLSDLGEIRGLLLQLKANETKEELLLVGELEKSIIAVSLLDREILMELEGGNLPNDYFEKLDYRISSNLIPLHEKQVSLSASMLKLIMEDMAVSRNRIKQLEQAETSSLYIYVAISVVLFSFFLAAIDFQIIKPIEAITKAIILISKGRFDTEISSTERNDEIGELARAFERTVVSLKLAMHKLPKIVSRGEKTIEEKFAEAFRI